MRVDGEVLTRRGAVVRQALIVGLTSCVSLTSQRAIAASDRVTAQSVGIDTTSPLLDPRVG